MTLDNRTWRKNGYGLIGETTDGRQTVEVTIRPIGAGLVPSPEDGRGLAAEIAQAFNQYGGTTLTATQERVLGAVARIEAEGWKANVPAVVERTGLSDVWVRQVVAQLVDLQQLERAQSGSPKIFRIPARERVAL